MILYRYKQFNRLLCILYIHYIYTRINASIVMFGTSLGWYQMGHDHNNVTLNLTKCFVIKQSPVLHTPFGLVLDTFYMIIYSIYAALWSRYVIYGALATWSYRYGGATGGHLPISECSRLGLKSKSIFVFILSRRVTRWHPLPIAI